LKDFLLCFELFVVIIYIKFEWVTYKALKFKARSILGNVYPNC